MSFTQNVFHPRGLPSGGQYVYVYGSKGAIDLMSKPTLYPMGRDAQPVVFAEKASENNHQHITAFYQSVVNGAEPPADVTIGATAALTSILGHEAMTKEKTVLWTDMGVDI